MDKIEAGQRDPDLAAGKEGRQTRTKAKQTGKLMHAMNERVGLTEGDTEKEENELEENEEDGDALTACVRKPKKTRR